MSKEAARPESTKWDTVFLVCKDCGKRGSGPKHLKPKTVASLVRQASKLRRPRPRIVSTGCLGLCPKSAIAVAVAGSPVATRIVAIRSEDQVGAAVEALFDRGIEVAV